MTPERWQQVQDVLEKALELAPADRSAYLDQACSSDSSFRHEVETLLAANPGVRSGFLQPSSVSQVTLRSGTKVGEYDVKSLLGSGGMGEVYRARDSRLGRDVAIKVLPSILAADSERLRRFEQEARAVAALNHPNILAIHQMGTYEGSPYMVSELLEGATLREQINRGRLSVRKAIDYGVQIAHGLAAAHEMGIIHRDLKPENLFVTKYGRVKILDFGLAKLTRRRPGSENSSPTFTDETEAGTVMGTVGYMSPEQVRGQQADHRTDIFSFGAILYEMLAGKRAFQKATAADTQSAILTEDPPEVSKSVPDVSPAMQRVVHRCLEKNPEQRFQSASDLAFALDALSETRGPTPSAPPVLGEADAGESGTKRRKMLYSVLLASVLVALGFVFLWLENRQSAAPKALTEMQLTHNNSENRLLDAAISPDGKHLAYTDTKGLHLSTIETGEVHDIPLPDDLRLHLWRVSWLSDGEELLFTTESEAEGYPIWITSIFGGNPRRLGTTSGMQGAKASPRDFLIAFVGGQGREIWVMDANGGNRRLVIHDEKEHYKTLAWSPTGNRLAYLKVADEGSARSLETIALDGGRPSLVIADKRLYDWAPLLWLPDGRLLFDFTETKDPTIFDADDEYVLWGMITDPRSGRASGKPVRITNSNQQAQFATSVSRDGRRLVATKDGIRLDVYVGELKEHGTHLGTPTRLTVSESYDWPSAWLPDGKTVLFSSNRTGKKQIFRQHLGQDLAEPLIPGDSEGSAEEGPDVSPDGHWILYLSSPRGATTARVMRIPVSGGPPEQVTEFRPDDATSFGCPTTPTTSCLFSRSENDFLIFHELDPIHGLGKELARTKIGLAEGVSWAVSPEGLRIAIMGWSKLRGQVRIFDLRNGSERNLQFPGDWKFWDVSWAADGNSLFAAVSSKSTGYFIARIEPDGKTHMLINEGRNHWISYPCPSPDGRYLGFGEQTFEDNAWMLENF